MTSVKYVYWCFLIWATKLVNCCNRCPEFNYQNCKQANDEFAIEIKNIYKTTQEVNRYLTQNLKELQKMTHFLQENYDMNKILSSLLPQVMKSNEFLLTSSKNLDDTSNLLTKVAEETSAIQDSVMNQLSKNSEKSERTLNASVYSLQKTFTEIFENFTSSLADDLKLELQPFDCYDVLQSGKTSSGVYRIYPKGVHNVFCDMETKGGGWTIFLFRQKQERQENFYRSWQDYKNGFGNPYKEYWLGNEAVYAMTRNKKYKLMLEARTEGADDIWGEWQTFRIDSEPLKYKIFLSGISNESTVYNDHVEGYFNNQMFSTFDADNDESGNNCAGEYKGGWWYKDCKNINPTGLYGEYSNEGMDFNQWSISDSQERYANWLQLKIRPVN